MRVRRCPWTPVGSPPLAYRDVDVVAAVSDRRRLQQATHVGWVVNFFRGSIAWLRAPCVRFAASVAADHATLGTGWLATPCRTGPSPAGALHKVSATSCFPLVRLRLAQPKHPKISVANSCDAQGLWVSGSGVPLQSCSDTRARHCPSAPVSRSAERLLGHEGIPTRERRTRARDRLAVEALEQIASSSTSVPRGTERRSVPYG